MGGPIGSPFLPPLPCFPVGGEGLLPPRPKADLPFSSKVCYDSGRPALPGRLHLPEKGSPSSCHCPYPQRGRSGKGSCPPATVPDEPCPPSWAPADQLIVQLGGLMYIGHIPDVGATALTGVGVTMPLILCISAFAALVSMGGAPGFHPPGERGKDEQVLGQLHHHAGDHCPGPHGGGPGLGPDLLLFFFGASQGHPSPMPDCTRIYAMGTLFVRPWGSMPSHQRPGLARRGCSLCLLGAGCNICWTPSSSRPGHGGWGCPGHGAVPRGLLPVGSRASWGKRPPSACSGGRCGCGGRSSLPAWLWGCPLYHAVHGEHPQRLFQHQPPPVRRVHVGATPSLPVVPPGFTPGAQPIVGFNYYATTGLQRPSCLVGLLSLPISGMFCPSAHRHLHTNDP